MKILIAFTLLALCCALASVSYYFAYYLPHTKDIERLSAEKLRDAERELEQARRCKEDGGKFFANFFMEMNAPNISWDDPQFHYSRKLNTCLVHTRYYMLGARSGLSFHYNQVTDVYSNRALFYGWFSRDVDTTPWTEKLMDPIDNKPNYTSAQFSHERDKLFTE